MIRGRVKIREGVARGLCGTCRESHIVTDDRGDQRVACSAVYQAPYLVQRVVVECNSYQAEHTGMDRDEAFKIGWVLETKRGGAIGFSRPKPKTEE